ncbi:hypothetical protein, partial [Streptococcus pseudopneumoniae]
CSLFKICTICHSFIITCLFETKQLYYLKDSGAMLTGWVKDSRSWYYLASTGKMLHNTYTPGGYCVDTGGAWK